MEIKLKRITLREYESNDWERVHLYASIPEFTKYEAWGPNSIEDTKNFINDMQVLKNKNPRFEFEFAVVENESGLLIGGCGLRREGQVSHVANFGYAINPDYQGKGFATEATKALLKFAFEELKLSVVYATCDADNIASYSVMKKCGLKEIARIEGKRKFKNKVSTELRYEITLTEYQDLACI